MEYILFDDDNQDIFNSPYFCSLDEYESEFRRAYIEPVYLSTSYSNEVDFNLNLTDTEIILGVDYDNEQDVWSSQDFWACLVVSCSQPRTSDDMDPDGNGPGNPESDTYITMGVTSDENDNAAVIFIETIQDYISNFESGVVAHEIGHTGGGEHSHGGLMTEGTASGTFTDITLNTFRENETWLATN